MYSGLISVFAFVSLTSGSPFSFSFVDYSLLDFRVHIRDRIDYFQIRLESKSGAGLLHFLLQVHLHVRVRICISRIISAQFRLHNSCTSVFMSACISALISFAAGGQTGQWRCVPSFPETATQQFCCWEL